MSRLRQAAAEAGRDMASLSVTVFRAPTEKKALAAYAEAGVSRVLLQLPSAGRDEVLALLDRYSPLLG
jgi:alkanesulfonate monooxygenase SsuD/methylene tetrahydromethanopterin reductase-like flavin-dependent oxidoreductase (luciferase family)